MAGGTSLTSSGYKHDLRLEERFATTIKGILGAQFFTKDPAEDTKGGTDFIIWGLQPLRVAVRLRTHDYMLKYPNDFTIRWSRPSGVETEIHKIRKGLVDYLFYGFVDATEARLAAYFIGNLVVFRARNPKPVCIKTNTPPDSQLAVYSLSQFPADFIVKRWLRQEVLL